MITTRTSSRITEAECIAGPWDYLAASAHHGLLSGGLRRLGSIAPPPQSLSVTVDWRAHGGYVTSAVSSNAT